MFVGFHKVAMSPLLLARKIRSGLAAWATWDCRIVGREREREWTCSNGGRCTSRHENREWMSSNQWNWSHLSLTSDQRFFFYVFSRQCHFASSLPPHQCSRWPSVAMAGEPTTIPTPWAWSRWRTATSRLAVHAGGRMGGLQYCVCKRKVYQNVEVFYFFLCVHIAHWSISSFCSIVDTSTSKLEDDVQGVKTCSTISPDCTSLARRVLASLISDLP